MGVLSLLMATMTVAGATTIDNLFELEGNLQANDGPGDDWSTLQAGSGTDLIAKTAIPIADGDSPTDTSYFTGGGSKDVNDVSSWKHSSSDVAPDKNEILNAAAAAYHNTDGDLVLFFAADRFDGSGDAAIGFWFFKNAISLKPDGTFSGVHADGDTLVVSDFTNGGDVATIRVFEWESGALQEKPVAGPVDCAQPTHNPDVCATVNDGTTSTIWPYTDKDGNSHYLAGAFYEGGINITDLVLGSDATPEESCFASFMAETRSSTSPNAQLKDFALGTFPVCAPSTSLSASATAEALAGTEATFTVSETNDGDSDLTDPFVTSDPDCGTMDTPVSGDTNSDGVFNSGETWVFECTSDVGSSDLTIDFVGHGTDFLGRDVTWHDDCTTDGQVLDTDSDGNDDVLCDIDEQASATVDVITPSTDLDLTASPTTVKSGDTVTLSFEEENDGDGVLENPGVVTDHADCTSATFVGGDTNTNGDLDPGETWLFECDVTIGDDDTTITATATGTILGHEVTWVAGCTATGDLVDTDSPPDGGTDVFCDQHEQTSVTVNVVAPSTELLKRASAVVTYTYLEHNDGDSDITGVTVTDDNCAPVSPVLGSDSDGLASDSSHNIGDLDNDNVLDPGETWEFTCTSTISAPSADGPNDPDNTNGDHTTSQTNTATASGTAVTGDTVTHCADPGTPPAGTVCDQDEQDSATVTITHHDNP